jgi:Bacterial protein of unknown function (DUF899)/Predicted metal-binding integral membrane protein (DUF2182)
MTKHQTGTRAEWLAARLELLEAEKELTHKGDEVARRRQELPWVRIDKEYRFDTDEGSASLADLFRGRSQLLVYHFMFGPDYTAGCPACSAIADGFNGFALHLANHDVTLAAVSRAPLAKLQGYKRRMGWTFPWASSFGSDFNADFSRPGRRVTWPAAGRCPGAARRCRPMPARPGVTACASGLHCSSCCSGLMAILLVIGVMDLRAMVLVGLAITAERLAPAGERVARAVGAVVVCAGLLLVARAAGLG